MRSTRREHPTDEQLDAHLRREAGAPDLAREHLEAGCIRCVTRTSERFRASSSLRAGARAWVRRLYGDTNGSSLDALERSLGREVESWSRLLALEEAASPELLERILTLPALQRRRAIRSRSQYQTLGFARYLTSRAREEVFLDVERALELANLSVEVADSLEQAGYSRGQAADARALAWGALANAHRVASELSEADRVLRQAWIVAREGSGDPLVEAELLSLEGSLRISQARFEEAQAVLEEAEERFARLGEHAAQVRVLTQLGKALGDCGAVQDAVLALEKAEQLSPWGESDPQQLYILQGKATYLCECGRAREARELFERIRPFWNQNAGGKSNELRLLWLDARISWGEGDLNSAEVKLQRVRSTWGDLEEAYEFALVSLDLAALFLEQGRLSEVKVLGDQMLPIFKSVDVHRHAVAALVLVNQAIGAGHVTVAFVQDVARYLRNARQNSSLPFIAHGRALT